MSTPYLQLPLDLVWMNTCKGIAVYSSSGAILLEGEDAGLVAERLFPLLDGTRTAAEILSAASDIAAPDLINILGSLSANGLLKSCAQLNPAGLRKDQWRASLQNAGILVSGNEGWTTALREALLATGVSDVIITAEPASTMDLAVGIFERTQTDALAHFIESSRHAAVPFLTCVVGGNEVFIGPVALPGRTACWNCAKLRMIANSQWREADSCSTGAVEGYMFISSLLASQICAAIHAGAERAPLTNHLLVLDRNSLQTSTHHVLPVPGCALCGGPEEGKITDMPTRPANDSIKALADRMTALFVDPLTGIVNRVAVEPSNDTGVEFPIVANAIPADAPSDTKSKRQMPVGWGKGMSASAAMVSAVGEAVERYSASMPPASRIAWSHRADLPGDVLEPPAFALYSGEQYERPDFPFVRFNPEVTHPWVSGEWLGSGAPVWVPAILAYLSYEVRRENLFCQGTSNGLAAGITSDEAALRAILELLERDSFMAIWRSKRNGQHIKIDRALDADLLEIVNGIRAFGAEVSLVLLSSACGYPTALCLAFGDGENWPGISLGLGTDPDPGTAVRQAVLELGQTGPYLRRLMKTNAYPVPASPQDVRQMLDHASYYFPTSRTSAFDYLRDSSNACSLSDLAKEEVERSLLACAEALDSAGIRVALVDVTSADIRSTPVRVVRAVSADLQPISFGYGLDRQAVPRLAGSQVVLAADEISPIW